MDKTIFVVCCVIASLTQAVGRPNVLFLVVDDLRPKLGCYGESNMLTPNIDQLAARSVRFNRAYVQQAVCSPSRTSFLTGRRPDTTRIFDLQNYFRKIAGNYTTLPQHFKDNGYVTQSVGKIFHPGSASGGTDDYPYSWSNPAFHAPTEKLNKICPEGEGKPRQRNAVCPVDLKTVPGGSLPDIQNTDFTIQFLRNRSQDKKPFFLGMGYHKPHLPFAYPKEYLDLYPMSKIHLAPNPYYPAWLPQVAWSPYGELRNYHDIQQLNISKPFGLVPVDYQYKLRQSYSAAASYTDAQVGRVLQALDQYGLADNTIITFHGDHGWQLGDHGTWCKHTNFDIATRIPMLVFVPGVTAKPAPPGQTFPFNNPLEKETSEKSKLDQTLTFQSERKDGGQGGQGQGQDRLGQGQGQGQALVSDSFVEAVDLYATISELAGLDVPPTCPDSPFKVAFCTEGSSLVPIIKNLTNPDTAKKTLTWKPAVFSQYPRSRDTWNSTEEEASLPTGPIDTINIMGYTMRNLDYRYTEWVTYNHTTFMPVWEQVHARELYIYSSDPDEDLDVAKVPAFQSLVQTLSQQLRAGWRNALPPAPSL